MEINTRKRSLEKKHSCSLISTTKTDLRYRTLTLKINNEKASLDLVSVCVSVCASFSVCVCVRNCVHDNSKHNGSSHMKI